MTKIWNFASYNLLNLHYPAPGQEIWHCDMKRGFFKAKQKEPQVKLLAQQDNIAQRIGLLAQKGVYEFHRDPLILYHQNSVLKIRELLNLSQELPEIQDRVITILKQYKNNPILLGKNIIKLSGGDEGYPPPIIINHDNYLFNLYPAIDCIFEERDGTIHILDFKTGHSDFDLRQGYIYLLAAQYLYPTRQAVASFYNLETQVWSDKITATSLKLKVVKDQLKNLAQKHQKELSYYRKNKQNFPLIFPPNPGLVCRYCPFNSLCQFSSVEVAV